jgi:hypothetical protein
MCGSDNAITLSSPNEGISLKFVDGNASRSCQEDYPSRVNLFLQAFLECNAPRGSSEAAEGSSARGFRHRWQSQVESHWTFLGCPRSFSRRS